MSPVLEATRAKRAAKQAELDALLKAPGDEQRALTDTEAEQFEKLAKQIKKIDRQIGDLEKSEQRAEKATAAAAQTAGVAGAYVQREQHTYEEYAGNLREGGASFLRDLGLLAVPGGHAEASEARSRLERHQHEMQIDLRGASKDERRQFEMFLDREQGSYESRVNPNTTAGTGGEFVPPLWLVSQYAPLQRADRIAANRVKNLPLPPGIDVINVPKITTGSLTAIQRANAAPVVSQDIVTTSVSANVNTIAGQEDISLQLLEQSPLAMDNVVFDDLTRDYSRTLDKQVLFGTGSNGEHQGVLTQTNATSNTDITKVSGVSCTSTVFADASTSATQLRSIANAVNQIETLRIAPATGIWVHPRRANNWMVTAFDTTGRPVFTPYSNFNAFGMNNTNQPEGLAGELLGLPVIKDGNLPTTVTTAGAVTGGTGDIIAVLKEDDLWLWESTLRMRALPEILSGTLQIRYQVYSYSAFLPSRFVAATSVIFGAGVAAPTF